MNNTQAHDLADTHAAVCRAIHAASMEAEGEKIGHIGNVGLRDSSIPHSDGCLLTKAPPTALSTLTVSGTTYRIETQEWNNSYVSEIHRMHTNDTSRLIQREAIPFAEQYAPLAAGRWLYRALYVDKHTGVIGVHKLIEYVTAEVTRVCNSAQMFTPLIVTGALADVTAHVGYVPAGAAGSISPPVHCADRFSAYVVLRVLDQRKVISVWADARGIFTVRDEHKIKVLYASPFGMLTMDAVRTTADEVIKILL